MENRKIKFNGETTGKLQGWDLNLDGQLNNSINSLGNCRMDKRESVVRAPCLRILYTSQFHLQVALRLTYY